MHTEIDNTSAILLIILGVFFAIIILTSAVIKWNRFSQELTMINMEIKRNTGSQREYWKRQKRRLWRYLIPFCK